jgi:small-conductance mechanosensitive channel
VNGLAAAFGAAPPSRHEAVAAVAAVAIVILVWTASWALGRLLGPRLAQAWERVAGTNVDDSQRNACALVRYPIAWVTLLVVLRAEAWPSAAAFLLGLGAAAASVLLVVALVRALSLPRWIGLVLGTLLFIIMLTDALGGLDPVSRTLDKLAFSIGSRRLSLLGLIQIVVALLALYAVVRLAIRLSGQAIRHAKSLDPTQQVLTQKLAVIAIIAIAFFVGIDLAGIDLTALAVFSGALGLAVGFGLQKTFGNLIAGIILLMDRSIKPGDVISVGESFGQVNKIGVRAVSIVTREGKEHLIPNELLMTQEVINWSYSTRDVRISITVGIDYDCDVELVRRLMTEAASASPRVLEMPKPVVWMTGFGESALDYEIRVWIADPEAGLGAVRSDILERLWALFKENGIQVPFPQRVIRVREWPAGSTGA